MQPAALPAAAAAAAVLGADDGGCAVWRSLAVSADPLAEVVPLLPDGGRVVQISISPDGTTLYAAAVGAAAAAAADGAGGEGGGDDQPSLARLASGGADGECRALGAAAEAMVATQAKAALARAKDQRVGAAPTGPTGEGGLPEEEAALRAVVSDAEALLAPLLMPLMRLLSAAPPLGAASLTVWLVLPPALAALPLELLPALRMPHVTSVGRDLSVSVLAKRLGHADGATCKKGSVGYAVDPRDEVTLPADAVEEKKTGSKPGSAKTKKGQAAAAEAEAPAGAPPSQSLCTAFERDILSGARVGYAKDWPKALLGSAAVPSAAQWQRTLRGAGAFRFLGPGPLLAQLKPEHIASLPLDGVACALLLDRLEADAASRRLAKEDNAKLPRHLALEEAHTAAALLSLAGLCAPS